MNRYLSNTYEDFLADFGFGGATGLFNNFDENSRSVAALASQNSHHFSPVFALRSGVGCRSVYLCAFVLPNIFRWESGLWRFGHLL